MRLLKWTILRNDDLYRLEREFKKARSDENERCAGILDNLREQLKGKNTTVVEKTLESSATLIRKSLNG